jgi:hypothetical protein
MKQLETINFQQIQEYINKMPSGIYELSQIIGAEWQEVASPHNFGCKFKQAVMRGLLRNIKPHTRKTNNHQTYLIMK